MKVFYHRKVTAWRVAIADVSNVGGEHWITRINVPPDFRGRGIARELLAEILKEADAEGVKLFLRVQASSCQGEKYLNARQLTAWYGRNGFKATEIPDIMTREPHV